MQYNAIQNETRTEPYTLAMVVSFLLNFLLNAIFHRPCQMRKVKQKLPTTKKNYSSQNEMSSLNESLEIVQFAEKKKTKKQIR